MATGGQWKRMFLNHVSWFPDKKKIKLLKPLFVNTVFTYTNVTVVICNSRPYYLSSTQVCVRAGVKIGPSWNMQMTLLLLVGSRTMFFFYFRGCAHTHEDTSIESQTVESVQSCKYLGTIIDSKLKFEAIREAVCIKGRRCLFCLRKRSCFHT